MSTPVGAIPNIPGQQIDRRSSQPLQRRLAELFKLNHEKSFPGAQPVSFTSEHLEELQRQDYWVCEKSDGVRCLLFSTCYPNEGPKVYLIDRKNHYYFIPKFCLPLPNDPTFRSFHNETVLDGELVLDVNQLGQKHLRYVSFDCMIVHGKDLTQRPLSKRLGYLREHVVGPFKHLCKKFPDYSTNLPFTLEVKKMEFAYGLERILNEIPFLQHKNDGLIFTSTEAKYSTGTCEKILKWKPAHENSVDFKIQLIRDLNKPNRKPIFKLFIWTGGESYQEYSEMAVTDQEWESWRNQGIKWDNRIVEVIYDPDHVPPLKWKFLRFRDDKLHANHISVLEKILKSIDDAVDIDLLKEYCPKIRNAWKERAATAQQ